MTTYKNKMIEGNNIYIYLFIYSFISLYVIKDFK